ncbi:MAG: hypothetical protein HKN73_16320, partial [Gemmatimonadetes bacterium]|nr:hypothetical protein [Gemmatimonadota bacterium]
MIRVGIALACLLSAAGCGSAEAQVLNPEEQISQALVAAPADKAEGARVLGFAEDGSMVE